MIVLGVLAASDRLARHVGEPDKTTAEDVCAFYVVAMGDMGMFAVFAALGYRTRRDPVAHKRLMLFATFALLDAAFDRWPIVDPYPLPAVDLICFVPPRGATFRRLHNGMATLRSVSRTSHAGVSLRGQQKPPNGDPSARVPVRFLTTTRFPLQISGGYSIDLAKCGQR